MEIKYVMAVTRTSSCPLNNGTLLGNFNLYQLYVLAEGVEEAEFQRIAENIGRHRQEEPNYFSDGSPIDLKEFTLEGVKRVKAQFEVSIGEVTIDLITDRALLEQLYSKSSNSRVVQAINEMAQPSYLSIIGYDSGAYDVLWRVLQGRKFNPEAIDNRDPAGRLFLYEVLKIPMTPKDVAAARKLLGPSAKEKDPWIVVGATK